MSEQMITFEDVRSERCDHCIHNPDAVKPFHKMKHLKLDDSTSKILDKLSEETGLNSSCIMCASVRGLVKMPVEEVVKLLTNVNIKP